MKNKLTYTVIILSTLFFAFISGENSLVLANEKNKADHIFKFAEHLLNNGDYYRSITEFKRLRFLYPDHELAKISLFNIANAYKKGRKFTLALQGFKEIYNTYPSLKIGEKALYLTSEIYYQTNDFTKAISNYTVFTNKYSKSQLKDNAEFKIGLSHLNLEEFKASVNFFSTLSPKSKYYNQAKLLAQEIENYTSLPEKSPFVSGLLSTVLPGAGQLYTKRYSDSIMSFLLNGLFIWATVELIQNGNEVTGGVVSFFEMGWYFGNIYNAVSNAHKFNRRIKRKFKRGLEKKYSVSFNLKKDESKKTGIKLSYAF